MKAHYRDNPYHIRQKLLPLEKEYQFHDFHSPALDDPDFDAKYLVSNSLLVKHCPMCHTVKY